MASEAKNAVRVQQAVSNKVQSIAAQYKDEDQKILYGKAADRFRLPFWDPCLPRNGVDKQAPLYNGVHAEVWGLPKILGTETVWVRRPGKTELEEMANPLYRFKFPNRGDIIKRKRKPVDFTSDLVSARFSFSHLTKMLKKKQSQKSQFYTIRSPGRDGGPNIYEHGYEEKLGLNLKIQRQGTELTTALWKLLARYDNTNKIDNRSRTWESFASHYVYKPGTQDPIIEADRNNPTRSRFKKNETSVSLESWHDKIHILVGTGTGYGGHMGDPAYAGVGSIPANPIHRS